MTSDSQEQQTTAYNGLEQAGTNGSTPLVSEEQVARTLKNLKKAIATIKKISPDLSEKEIRTMILSDPQTGKAFEGLDLYDDDIEEGKKKMPRGRPSKNTYKAPTRVERQELLRARIMNLKEELENTGFGALLAPPPAIKPIADPVPDPKTKGLIAHVEEPLGFYIQRVSVQDNFAQRQPFDHLKDPIYMGLIRDFIERAAMPEAKIAALSAAAGGGRAQSLTQPDIRYSVIDGLQRLYCYLIAILLVFQREKLVEERCLTKEAWEYFREAVEASGDAQAATQEILKRPTRYEIFYQIDLEGLLHYMVTFNTGQRRMSLDVQLEIMQRPLIDELALSANIPIWHETQNVPGKSKPKEQFSAADLIISARAFITANPQVKKQDQTEELLEADEGYLELDSTFDVGDINDVVQTLKKITTDVHKRIMVAYAENPTHKYILANGGMFLLSFAAACGKLRSDGNMGLLDAALLRLDKLIENGGDDPLNLDEYQRMLAGIKSSRGKAIRRLVYDTFRRFFNGTTSRLEWADTYRGLTL
jgi:hypothetical protein